MTQEYTTTSLINFGLIKGTFCSFGVAAGRIVKRGAIATKDGVVTVGAATGRIALGAVHSVASAVAEKTKR